MENDNFVRRNKMSRKWMLVLIVGALCTLAGCSEQQLAMTLMNGQNTDLKALVGVKEGNTELGGIVQWRKKDDIDWGPEPTEVGAYVRYYLTTQDAIIEDTPESSLLAPWLDRLHARPYVGLDFLGSTDCSMRHVQPNWVVGTTFSLEPKDVGDAKTFINVAYTDGDQASGDTFVGLTHVRRW